MIEEFKFRFDEKMKSNEYKILISVCFVIPIAHVQEYSENNYGFH